MAISATFVADFSSFSKAVEKADVQLRSFEQDVAKIDKSIAKFGNQFSGQKVIQDALAMEKAIQQVGGMSKLTGDELARAGNQAAEAVDKMKRMGIDVPPQLQKLADSVKPIEQNLTLAGKAAGAAQTSFGSMFGSMFTALNAASLTDKIVGGLVEFGKAAFESAGHIADLSDQTGLSTDAIQRMEYVAKQTGSELDTFTKSAQKLGINLATGTKATTQAVGDLGLSYAELQRMKPDEQFTAVMEALGKVTDAGERNRLGNILLGKSFYEMGAAAVSGYKQMADAATVAGEKQIRALDAAGDAWEEFKGKLSTGFGQMMGNQVLLFQQHLQELTDGMNQAKLESGEISNYHTDTGLDITGQPFRGAVNLPSSGPPGATAEDRAAAAADAEKKHAEAIKAANAARKEQIDLVQKLTGLDQAADIEKQIAAMTAYGQGYHIAGDELKAFLKNANEAADALDAQGKSARADKIRDYANALKLTGTTMNPLAAQIVVVGNAVENQADAFYVARGMATEFDKALDISAVSASALEKALGKVDDQFKHIDPPTAKLTGFAGGVKSSFDSLVKGLTGGDGLGGFMKTLGSGITKGFGDILSGGISSAISMGVGLAVKGAQKIFGALTGAEGKKTNDERDALIKSTYGTEDALRKLAYQAGATDAQVRKIFATKTVDSFKAAIGEVQGIISTFADDQAADASRLTNAIDKYGFAFEELGAVLQKSKLDEQSKDLIEDWRVLIEAGIDVATVNTKMAAEVNKFIATAKKTGTEVPSAMKPMLQKMIDQGVLTDEAGNKIEDLQTIGVTFADTMTQGFDKVVKKLEELIDRLAGPDGVAAAIDKIPSEKHVEVIFDVSGDVPSGQGDFHVPGRNQPQSFATGTGGKFLDFGSGTPATLHGRERVMTLGESDGSGSVVSALQAMQAVLLRAMRENALQARDQMQLARA